MGWLLLVALIAIPAAVYSSIQQRKCPNCGQMMQREMDSWWSNQGQMTCGCGYIREFVRRSSGDTSHDETVAEHYPQPPRRRLPPRKPRSSIRPGTEPARGSSILPADVPKPGQER